MAITFRAPDEAIDLAVRKLKADGIVHPEARFNPNAPGDLRREIAYYDQDFLRRVGRASAEEQTVDAALTMLKEHDLVPASASYDKEALVQHRELVRENFVGGWTSLTPTMERLIYMLTSVRRPMHLLELGSFWGFTLAWFAGPGVGPHRCYNAERIIGIDIDEKMTTQARSNFAKLPDTDRVQLIGEDARTALDHVPGPFDFVYIEAKLEHGDGLYLDLLKQVYDRLTPGAWVIAHDNIDWSFAQEMANYLPYVRDPARFRESVSFEVDECGLELSIR
jgi:predicted O-methyltransferase YrrM